MGCVNFGAPQALIRWIQTTFEVKTFIETGTHYGTTSAWASGLFEQVITIEGSAHFHAEASRTHADKKNIEFLLGDSPALLPGVLAGCQSPAVLWLDAHWMGVANVFGDTAECPVMQEIAAALKSNPEHFLLIDDARFFVAPPPRPHRAADWPTISELLLKLDSDGAMPRYTVIHEDVIVSFPASARQAAQDHYQDIATDELQRATQAEARKLPVWNRMKSRIKRGLLAVKSGR